MILLAVVVLCSVLLLFKPARKLLEWWRHIRYLDSHIPTGGHMHWLLGHHPPDKRQLKDYRLRLIREKPRIFLRRVGPFFRLVSLAHPETVAEVMRHGPGKNEFVNGFYRLLLKNGLAQSSGKRWARDRKLLTHVFTQDMLKAYVPVYKDACDTMLELWSERVGESLNVSPFFPLLAFDVIMRCALGVKTSCQVERDEGTPAVRYYRAVDAVMRLTTDRFLQPWYYNDWVYLKSPPGRRLLEHLRVIQEFSGSLIEERRRQLQNRSAGREEDVEEEHEPVVPNRQDMLDILLSVRDEDGVGMDDVDIREQVDTFLFAGRDTSSHTLEWAMLHLANYPDIQERCRDEAASTVSAAGGLEKLGHEHLSHLTYINMFILETFRHSNVVPAILRSPQKDVIVDGYTIPAGTALYIDILGLHHNPQVWEHPEVFDPDRFSPDKGERHQYAFMPFAAGARNCIGKHFAMDELKVVLCMILLKFRILQDPTATPPYWEDVGIARPSPSVDIRLEFI